MNPSTTDEIKGTAHEVKGKVKETAGKVTKKIPAKLKKKSDRSKKCSRNKSGGVCLEVERARQRMYRPSLGTTRDRRASASPSEFCVGVSHAYHLKTEHCYPSHSPMARLGAANACLIRGI
jgi:hypothetical protein